MQRLDWKAYAGSVVLLMCGAAAVSGRHFSKTVHAAEPSQKAPFVSWTSYGGSNSDAQYSALAQIDRSNAGKLQQV
jgi:quinoprotein glucose dehydrogenase